MPYLLFLKSRKIWNCRLLQIIGGALWVNDPVSSKRYKLACVPIKDSDRTAGPMQSDQSLHLVPDLWSVKGPIFFFRQKTKALFRLRECTNWFESSLNDMSTCTLCWICLMTWLSIIHRIYGKMVYLNYLEFSILPTLSISLYAFYTWRKKNCITVCFQASN